MTLLTGIGIAVIGVGFLGTGAFARRRRPANGTGTLMMVVGLLWFGGALTDVRTATIFAVSVLLSVSFFAALAHLLLAFPTGRLASRSQRILIAALYVIAIGHPLTQLLLLRHPTEDRGSPASPILLTDRPDLAGVLDAMWATGALLAIVLIVRELVRRWRGWTTSERRTLAPVLWTGVSVLGALAVAVTLQSVNAPDPLAAAFQVITVLGFLALPYAFLAGLLRSRYSRAESIDELIGALAGAADRQNLRDSLATALGDPTLVLVFHRADRDGWVDADGVAFALPDADDPLRAVTVIERDGQAIGALVHDASLRDETALLGTAASAASLAVDNDRLAAELRARIAELEESRAKVVTGALAERRRLERDLHDGAQQRLVSLSLQLSLARARVPNDPAGATDLLGQASDELALALEELRELARGIHPAVLTDRGLHAAVEALADRSPLPVEVRGFAGRARLPVAIEAAAYFVIAEALTNVAKSAGARTASVSLSHRGGDAVVEVADDGRGGAAPAPGSGLAGLVDRLGALDGRLIIRSPQGAGTVIRAEIPCGS
jgi:signal transduction histidine kinase